ncbi:hypothetical protein STEG23_023340, partial [Scotinomys teguina]
MTVTPLGQDQDSSLKNRELDVPVLLVPGSWRLGQGRCGWTVLHLPWNLYPDPLWLSDVSVSDSIPHSCSPTYCQARPSTGNHKC